ncbi:MAG: hypothetical protein IK954_09060 [Clostridia bacterium]|nr:hypothetical protein [Clostridia bacterium]
MKSQDERVYTRKNHRRVKSMPPMNYVSPYIMVERSESSNYFSDTVDAGPIDTYMRQKRKEDMPELGLHHILLAAYVRTVAERPGINRFIRGQKIYARDRIVVNMAIKRDMALNAQETILKMVFKPDDTVKEVYEIFQKTYNESVGHDVETGFDSAAKIINYIPGLIKKFVVWVLKLLDYFGLLPNGLTNVSPFHGSLFITSMGSLGIKPIFHHLYNFGHVPAFISFGRRRHATELDVLGQPTRRSYYDLAVVTDERICDGFYYASAWKQFTRFLKTPEILETVPEVTPDIP